MKSICPTCKSPLYIPDEGQSLRRWSVLCSCCHAIYFASPGTVVGAWLRYRYRQQVVYQAQVHLQTGSTKTVELDKLININEPIVLLTPLKGLGKLKPILLIETKTATPIFLVHPRQHIRKLQLQGVIWTTIPIVLLGLSLQGTIDTIVVVAVVSSLVALIAISRLNRGEENNPQLRSRLCLEQQLLRQSDGWDQRLQQLQKELSSLHHVQQRLLPYDENQRFRIDSLSKVPRGRRYFEDRCHRLNKLIKHYILAKDLIDSSIYSIQLTEEVHADLRDQLIEFTQEIEHLEEQYQAKN